jgi:hypothetical protein
MSRKTPNSTIYHQILLMEWLLTKVWTTLKILSSLGTVAPSTTIQALGQHSMPTIHKRSGLSMDLAVHFSLHSHKGKEVEESRRLDWTACCCCVLFNIARIIDLGRQEILVPIHGRHILSGCTVLWTSQGDWRCHVHSADIAMFQLSKCTPAVTAGLHALLLHTLSP